MKPEAFTLLSGEEGPSNAPIQYTDGRTNNWFVPPAETRYL